MPNGKPVQINFRVPEDEKEAFERAAYWRRLSLSDYMRDVLRKDAEETLTKFGERPAFLPKPKDER